jgi:monoamine oxidase
MVYDVQVSLSEWNQDERFGAFGGPHAMVLGGYGQLADAMAAGVNDIRYNEPVTEISYTDDGVSVSTQSGMKLSADAVIVSVPIGVLQKGHISFSPPLPEWKTEAFTRIGMGKLNKVRFPEQ